MSYYFIITYKLILIVVKNIQSNSTMLRTLLNRFLFSSKAGPNRLGQMAQKIEIMNKTMHQTSPKMFSVFFILSTIPTFYFSYKFLTAEYNDPQLTTYATSNFTYINLKNVLFYSVIATLSKMKYNSPTAKFTLQKRGLLGRFAPLFLSFIALSLPQNSDSKYIVLPTFFADVSMVIFEAQMANYGVYPFWMYSYRHFIRFFEWATLIIMFFGLAKLRKRIKSHPYEFTEEENEINQQNINDHLS